MNLLKHAWILQTYPGELSTPINQCTVAEGVIDIAYLKHQEVAQILTSVIVGAIKIRRKQSWVLLRSMESYTTIFINM